MRRRGLAVVLLLVATLAGCAETEDASRHTDAPPPPGRGELANDLDACREVVLVVPRDRAELQNLLPDGFAAADARKVLGIPTDTGRGVAAMGVIRCEGASLAEGELGFSDLGIVVDPPDFAGIELEPASVDVYLVRMFTDSALQIDAFGPTGLDVVSATIGSTVTGLGPAFEGRAVVEDDDGSLLSVEAEGLGPAPPRAGLTRLWQDTGSGIAVFDYEYGDLEEVTTAPARCTVRSPSIAVEVLGSDPCDAPGSIAQFYPDVSFSGVFRFFEDAGEGGMRS